MSIMTVKCDGFSFTAPSKQVTMPVALSETFRFSLHAFSQTSRGIRPLDNSLLENDGRLCLIATTISEQWLLRQLTATLESMSDGRWLKRITQHNLLYLLYLFLTLSLPFLSSVPELSTLLHCVQLLSQPTPLFS